MNVDIQKNNITVTYDTGLTDVHEKCNLYTVECWRLKDSCGYSFFKTVEDVITGKAFMVIESGTNEAEYNVWENDEVVYQFTFDDLIHCLMVKNGDIPDMFYLKCKTGKNKGKPDRNSKHSIETAKKRMERWKVTTMLEIIKNFSKIFNTEDYESYLDTTRVKRKKS